MDIEAALHRSLLYGVIASQLHYLGPGPLARAMNAWSKQPGAGSIGDVLLAQRSLAPEDLPILDRIVERQAEIHGGFPEALLAFGGVDEARRTFDHSYEISAGHIVESAAPVQRAGIGTWTSMDPAADDDVVLADSAVPAPPDLALATPERYTIKGEHGRGAIGRVLLAVDEQIGREVALKELLTSSDRAKPRISPAARDRFLREARLTGRLNHPSIVPVYEIGTRDDGAHYYTMRFVRGVTMEERLGNYFFLPERIQLLPAFLDVCHALAYAHACGIIHRDLKPANVMLGQFGETVVLDWGLAKARGTKDPDANFAEFEAALAKLKNIAHTVPGQPFGSPCYMSPEQAYGRLEEIDEKSDVWSLGAMLYEVLTGQPPFMGEGALEVVEKVRTKPVRPVRELEPEAPEELCVIAETCLQKDRALRYADAGEVADKVSEVVLVLFGPMSFVRVREEKNEALEQRRQAEEARALAEQREREARVNLAEAYFQYGLRAEKECRLSDARVYFARSLSLAPREDSRSGLVREALHPFRVRAERSWPGPGKVTALAGSPDGKLLAAAGEDRTVTGWALAPDRHDFSLGPFEEPPVALDFLPDSRGLALAVGDLIKVVSTDGTEPITLAGHDSDVTCLLAAPDNRVLSGSADLTLKLWSIRDRRCLRTFAGHDDRITALAADPAFQLIASAGWDKTIRVWDPQSGDCLHTLVHDTEINALAFGPDATLLAGDNDHVIKIWELRTQTCVQTITGHPAPIIRLAVNLELGAILSADESGQLRASSLAAVHCQRVWNGHPDLITAAWLPAAGARLAAAGADHRVRTWTLSLKDSVAVIAGPDARPTAAVFSPDQKTIIAGGADRTVRRWALEPPAELAPGRGHEAPVSAIAVSPDGKFAASGSWDDSVRLWSLPAGDLLRTLAGHEGGGVIAAAFTPDGTHVLSASYDNVVKRWAVATGRCDHVYQLPKSPVSAAVFDPGRGLLLTGGCARREGPRCRQGRLQVWSLETEQCILDRPGHPDSVACIAVAPDGAVATGSVGGLMVHFLDGTEPRVLESPRRSFKSAAFSPDGRWLAGGAEDGSITLWSRPDFTPVAVLPGLDGSVSALDFSPDGAVLLAASPDSGLRLWPLLPHLLDNDGDSLLCLACAETGTRLMGFELVPD